MSYKVQYLDTLSLVLDPPGLSITTVKSVFHSAFEARSASSSHKPAFGVSVQPKYGSKGTLLVNDACHARRNKSWTGDASQTKRIGSINIGL